MDLSVERLGAAKIRSPLHLTQSAEPEGYSFVPDDQRVLYDVSRAGWMSGQRDAASEPASEGRALAEPLSFERAGPRELIYFDPSKVRAGIVTCGGLCPGINNVVRSLVMELHYRYGVRRIYGFRYGFAGLVPECGHETLDLSPETVRDIHHDGGSVLGSSRGFQEPEVLVDTLERMGIGLFYVIGGDGTLRGAEAVHREVQRRGLKISVIGVPKTIDNDILLVEKTFGFETAFSIAIQAIRAAHVEATGYPNGIGLVRLMGRHSGYIAATAAIADADVNCVLVPEQAFALEGAQGLLPWLEDRLRRRGHAVLVVAEGAGQDLLETDPTLRDASGNLRLGDVGLYLKQRIGAGLTSAGIEHSLKYIDPSYIIRSAPANPNDSLFCSSLAQNAVHAGMSGRTGMVVGLWHNVFTHVPLAEVTRGRKVLDLRGELWRTVVESTGQPSSWGV